MANEERPRREAVKRLALIFLEVMVIPLVINLKYSSNVTS
jgi:hypothetical protein